MKQTQTQNLKTLKIISLGMMFSIFTFLLVNYLIHSQPLPDYYLFEFYLAPEKQMFLFAFLFMCAPATLISLFLPKIINANSNIEAEKKLFFNWNEFTNRMYTTTIIRMFLADWIALFGFILSFMNHAFLNMVPFAMVSLVLIYMYSPFYKTHTNDVPY